MPFARPSLNTLIDRTAADIESRLPGADARLRRQVLTVLARAHAGAVHGLYGHLEYLADQLMPDSAEVAYLERWAAIWGVERKPSDYAAGNVIFTGNNGAVIPAATILQRADGAEFTVTAEATIAAGTATAQVTATVAGLAGNTDAGASLSLVSPISGVQSSAVAGGNGLTNGADPESDAALRLRLLDRIRQPPAGGSHTDYEAWALEVAGVTRAWCYPLEMGPGTVTVRFVVDDDPGGFIPDAAKIAEVLALIETRRPVTAEVYVTAPIPVALDLTIALAPNTSTVQAAVEAELNDLLRREAMPEDGNGSGTIRISHIREAISIAAGETDHELISPVADVIHDPGEIAVLGTITWQGL